MRGQKGIYQIQSELKRYLGNKEEKLYTATHIKNILKENNINHVHEGKPTYIDLPEADSPEYHYLISFLLQRTEECLAPEIYQAAKEYLSSHYKSEIQHDVSFFWLRAMNTFYMELTN